MKDSNNFHACCMDSYPALIYLTEKSIKLIHTINKIN